MCGIVYAWRKDGKPANKRILKRYGRQSDRGQEGFGYVSLDESGNVLEYKRTQDEEAIREALGQSASQHVLFHHRFPTSTVNVSESAHPILVKNKELKHSYYVVHNGVITNSRALKLDHIEWGYKYTTELRSQYKTANGKIYNGDTSFNDSESLAIELARTIEGLQSEVRATGSIACIILQANKAGTKVEAMYYGTNGQNPLTVNEDATGIIIASEGGKPITPNVMWRLDFVTDELSTVDVHLRAPVTHYPYGSHAYTYYNGQNQATDVEGNEMKEEDYEPVGAYGNSIQELSQALDDIEGDIQIAIEAGEDAEREELEIERESIMWQLQEMVDTEAQQARIGF